MLIGLVTDFGPDDVYVGQMKAALLSGLPDPCRAQIVDLTHSVAPHDVEHGAFFLAASAPALPPESLMVAVVDPGVGGERRIVAARCRDRWLIAPDNGLVSLLDGPIESAWEVGWSPDSLASAVFHGRDVIVPAAARLAARLLQVRDGTPPLPDPLQEWAGVDPSSLLRLESLAPRVTHGMVRARVLHADRFGNLVLGLPTRDWQGRLPETVELSTGHRARSVSYYSQLGPGELGVLPGSQGFLELAVNLGSAAGFLGLQRGDAVGLGV